MRYMKYILFLNIDFWHNSDGIFINIDLVEIQKKVFDIHVQMHVCARVLVNCLFISKIILM